MMESPNSCDEEIAVDAEIFLAEMKAIFGERLDKFREALQEGKKNKFSVVKIVFNDTRVDSLRVEKIVK